MLIGLDLGTTTISGVLWDAERYSVLRAISRRNDSAIPAEVTSRAEQDPRRIYALALQVVKELAAGSVPVDGIGLTGQMHGLLCADAANEPLTPLISWQDRRTSEPLPGGGTPLDEIEGRTADLAWEENGCRIAHGYGAATLFWLVRQGALPAATRQACTLSGWLAARLAGCPPVIDPGLAASWGVLHLVDGSWNQAFLERLSLDGRLLPPVWPSGKPLGGLTAEAARRVGLPAGVPVYNPLGDQPAAFLATVSEPDSSVSVNLGTGGQVAWKVAGFEPATPRAETRPLPGGQLLRVGASLCGGAAYAWLNRTVRNWLAEFGLEIGEEAAYERLNELAGSATGATSLRVRTTFLGVRGDPVVQAGAIDGITPDNLELGVLARATLLGMIDELLEIYRSHCGPAAGHRLLVAGGNGVRKNPRLPGLLSERFGLPVRLSPWSEPAAVGAAMVAGRQGL